jgi:hypothetical protein
MDDSELRNHFGTDLISHRSSSSLSSGRLAELNGFGEK